MLLSICAVAGLSISTPVSANSGGITGQSTAGCTLGGCHGDSPGSYNYNAIIQRNLGSWSSANATIDSNSSLPVRFLLDYVSGTAGSRGGFNMSVTGGSLSESDAEIDDNGTGSGELTHTTPRTLTGNDVIFSNISFDASSTTSGSFTIRACGQPVNFGGNEDDDGPDDCDTLTVTVRPVINNWSGTVTYNENTQNGAFVSVDSSISIFGSANMNRAESNIVSPLTGDDLGCPSPAVAGISCSDTGDSIVLTGTATRASYDTAIQRIRFRNTSEDPSTANRTVRVRVRDSSNVYSNYVSKTIDVNPQNDAPTAANDGAAGAGLGHVTVNEGDTVAGVGNLLANDNDVDDTPTASRAGPGCAAVSTTESTAFTLNSDGTFDYSHDGSEPVQDSFSYCAFDGSLYSSPVTVYIDIAPVNDAPTVAGFSGSVSYTEQTPAVIDNSITISDSDSSEINRARLTIAGNFTAGDSLSCGALPGGISCSAFDIPSRTITLSGQTSYANYQTAIGGVTFNSTSDNPNQSTRTIELDVRDEDLGTSIDYSKTITPIIRANDPPTIAAIPAQAALEDTAADPFTFTYTAVASDVDVNDDTNTGNGTLFYSLSGAPGGMTISNTNPTHGQISWNPPITGVFGQVYGPITVLIEDGDEDGSAPNSVSFSITVSPPDDDSDNVANYDDLCLTVPDPTNADNDGDGTPGSDGGANDGGDVCDLDDDNDGMPDTYEIANSLNPFVDDANDDNDGDGVSNIDEFLAGTNPNLVNLVIDATGYFTPFELTAPDPTSIHSLATAVTISDPGPYRPGDNTVTWTPSNSSSADLAASDPGNLVSNPPDQPFFIRPLLSFDADQRAEEGSTVTVTLYLNGEAPVYPVTVDYSVSGSASGADYTVPTPASGAVVFNDTTPQTITFDLTAADGSDAGETVVFTLDSATNAALGTGSRHRVTIIEGNVAPAVSLDFSQGGDVLATTYDADGAVTVDAVVNDINAADLHSYDWSGSDNALVPPGDVASWMPMIPGPGNYLVEVVVTDNGAPSRSTRVSRVLSVVSGSAPGLGGGDTDGDGTADNDATEGHADDDGDGIPNYLDSLDGLAGNSNLIPDQTVDMSNSQLLETRPGLTMTRGNTAQSSGLFGTLLTDRDVRQFGSAAGGRPRNADDSFDHATGVYDFEVRGLVPGEIVNIVIPLQTAIPRNAVYRKFVDGKGWNDFVTDNNNKIASAVGATGACPEPGSDLYRKGLNYLDNCIQLTIKDGGPNDADGKANGVIVDPGTTGIKLSDPEIEEVEDGGSRMSPILIAVLALLGVLAIGRRRREAA